MSIWQVYVPVLAKRHWFLAVINMFEKKVNVFDNFSIPSYLLCGGIIMSMLCSMDNAFSEQFKKVYGSDFSFTQFSISEPISHRYKCVDYDCSVYVTRMLLQEYVKGVLGDEADDVVDDYVPGIPIRIGPLYVPREFDWKAHNYDMQGLH
ncbi:uncharacterized protein LOC133791587 [Humulus lupulus]|uniref:uncharacterized protein LOC133791587 n=1 Tax=Humulus lupulus TaxID=3486 RepID=UPI002B4038EF|nr:uncharacterized protein LOC133791587 [Humulus lupulus]